MKFYTVCYCLLFFLVACAHEPGSDTPLAIDGLEKSVSSNNYAAGFRIENRGNYTLLNFMNPWKEGIYKSYALVPKSIEKLPLEIPNEALIIRTPVSSTVALSASQIGLLSALNLTDRIKGVGSLRYLYSPKVRAGVESETIALVGYEGGLNNEAIIALQPELLIADGFETIDPKLQRLEQAGIPVLYFLDWMESEPLARLEWIKVIGCLYGREKQAQDYFQTHEQHYLDLARQAEKIAHEPYVFSGNNFKGTWYMAGGNSFLAHLFRDAGAQYRWAEDSTRGSIPLSLEKVMENHLEDDFWLNPNARSLAELRQTDQRYPLFKAYRNKQVYSPIKRSLSQGGNDYWESGMAQPDLLLKDLIIILHPHLLPNDTTYYYQQLN